MDWTESYFEHAYSKRWALGPPSATTRKEAGQFLTLLSPPPELPLLDVGCGHGRYSAALASLGHRVVGIDASRALLELATRQAPRGPTSPLWVRGDMRRLPFAPRFGGALLLDSFGFFAEDHDNAEVLRELRRVLPPKGRLIVAVANTTPILAEFRPHDVERRSSTVIEIDRTLQRDPTQLVEALTVREAGDVTHYERRQRLYSCAELTALVEAAAFVVQAVFGDYAGGRFDEAASAKFLLLAKAAA